MLLMSDDDLFDIVQNSGAYYNFQYGMFELKCDANFTLSVFANSNEFKCKCCFKNVDRQKFFVN